MEPLLQYPLGLTVDQIISKYGQVEEEFKQVRSKYSGLTGFFLKSLQEEDKIVLLDCIREILPLSIEEVVQVEHSKHPLDENTWYYRIDNFQRDVLDFMKKYRNSGLGDYL